PISRNANPACMNITSTPATITQVVLTLDTVSDRLGPLAADVAVGMASAVASATTEPASSRLRTGAGGAAPVALLDMNPPMWAPAARVRAAAISSLAGHGTAALGERH